MLIVYGMLQHLEVIRYFLTLFHTGVAKFPKFYVMESIRQLPCCQVLAMWRMSYGRCSTVQVLQSLQVGRPKLSFSGRECADIRRRLMGPILVVAISKLSDVSPQIWSFDLWIGIHSLCDITTIVLQIKLYFVLYVYHILIWKLGSGIIRSLSIEIIIFLCLILFSLTL